MTTAIEIIEQQIALLASTASEERRKAELAAKNAETCQIQLKALQDALRLIQKQAAEETPRKEETKPDEIPAGSATPTKLKPSDAVLEYFKTHSQGSFSEVVDALEFRISTDSDKPRQIIRNTMAALERSGKLKRNGIMFYSLTTKIPANDKTEDLFATGETKTA